MLHDISDSVKYIGVDDKTIDLFESQYIVPNGISYNSYVIIDELITVMDTSDKGKVEEWFANLQQELNGATPHYLVVHHMEPDHASGVEKLVEAYPEIKIVGNAKTFVFLSQFTDVELENRKVVVKEGDELSLGEHTLKFFMAPMVHWPEVMVSYDVKDKILFSADGFGKFGALDTDEDWACEARRYYFNIVGKYGANVQALLKKAATLDIQTIAPLHGPILRENLGYYLDLYNTWSSYAPENDEIVIAYASIHGNTKRAAEKLAEMLVEAGREDVNLVDLAREDMAESVESAFECKTLVLAASSYDAGLFPPMEHFLSKLKHKNFQKRRVAVIENGSWAPSAAKVMHSYLEQMKGMEVYENTISLKSRYNEQVDGEAVAELVEWLLK